MSLASVGELGVRASIVGVDALGGSASLEDGWKIWSETPLAETELISRLTYLCDYRTTG